MSKRAVVKCSMCKKPKGDHKAVTLNCPMGMKHRAGVVSYFNTQVFVAPLPKVSRRSRRVLEQFDMRARDWGWQQDRGVGDEVARSEASHREARSELYQRIAELEARIIELED